MPPTQAAAGLSRGGVLTPPSESLKGCRIFTPHEQVAATPDTNALLLLPTRLRDRACAR